LTDALWHSGLFLSVVFQAGASYMFLKAVAARVTALEARVERLTDQGTQLAVMMTKLDTVEAEMLRMRTKLEQFLEKADK
jgi:hypothetical protein